ncbi:MAG: hypothetical protein H6861_06540 [Rhodospirillales bacterium]|nr:hypothetical protein [Rhodospirillales bacterium]
MEKWKKKFAVQAFSAAAFVGAAVWSGFAAKTLLDERDALYSGPKWDKMLAEFKPLNRKFCEKSLLTSDVRAALENQREEIVQRAVDSHSSVLLKDYVLLSRDVPFPSEERIEECQSEMAVTAAQDAVYGDRENKKRFASLAAMSSLFSAALALGGAHRAWRTYRRREENEPGQGQSAPALTNQS